MGREHSRCPMESSDPRVRWTMSQARIAAASEVPILIRGEKGTGKHTLARVIHAWSQRSEGPFVRVNCASLSPDQLELELSGRNREESSDGKTVRIAEARPGTLFLDEVGVLPVDLQPELLREIRDQFNSTDDEAPGKPVLCRILAGTSQDLGAEVQSGRFSQELLYRLSLIELALPPLRLRSDLLSLADHFLTFFAFQTGNRLTGFSAEARKALGQHAWPGNLCELRNAIERAAILASGPEVTLADLPDQMGTRPRSGRGTDRGRSESEPGSDRG